VADVVVQAGHCHRTRGATGTHREQEFTWALGRRLRDALAAAGHTATLVGADDRVPPSDVFVALHTDGSGNPRRRGASVGYPDDAGRALARAWKLEHQRGGFPGGFLADNYTAALRGYYGFRKSRAPVRFLAEHGTTTNRDDERWLFDHLEQCAAAHVRAIGLLYPTVPLPADPDDPPEEPAMLTIVHAEDRASCLLRPDGTLFPLDTNDEVRAYQAAGARTVPLTQPQWDAVNATSQRILAGR
jgi:hypothetical protein